MRLRPAESLAQDSQTLADQLSVRATPHSEVGGTNGS